MTTERMVGRVAGEAVFRKLERIIKKTFENELWAKNLNISGSESRVKSIWLGPGMKNVLSLNPGIVLKQSEKSFIVYQLKV